MGTNLITFLRVGNIQNELSILQQTISNDEVLVVDEIKPKVTEFESKLKADKNKTKTVYKNIIKKELVEKVIYKTDTIYVDKIVKEHPSYIRTINWKGKEIKIMKMEDFSVYINQNEIYNLKSKI